MVQIYNNTTTGLTELYINHDFVASWEIFDMSDRERCIIEQMITYGVSEGEKCKSQEIKDVLGIK